MVSSLGLGYIPGRWLGPNILESEGFAMLQRRRAPLFAGLAASFAALTLAASPAESQTRVPPPVQQTPLDPPGAAAAPMPNPVGAPIQAQMPVPAAVPPAGAAMAADPYAVSGVLVDISASNANAARDQAISQAQSKAWAELYARLVPGGSAPRMSERDLARLVQGFEIDDERVSATRYVGSFTVRFRESAVREMLAGSTSQYVEPPSRPFVLLPVTVVDGRPVLWEDRTPWRAAWEERPASSSLVPLLVPDGELADISAIGAEEALAGNPEALARIAQRYNAQGVVVARATLPAGELNPGQALTVDVTRYDADGGKAEQTVPVQPDAADRPEDFLIRATNFVGAAIDKSWQNENVVASGPEQATLVRLPLRGLEELVAARKRLAGVPGLTRMDVLSLSREAAVVALTHRGDVSALQQALERQGMALYPDSPAPAYPPLPGQPTPSAGPVPQWQLSLRPGAAPRPAAGVAGGQAGYGTPAYPAQPQYQQPGYAQPGYAQPYEPQPGMAPGAPPRTLGTLPATGAPRY